MISYVSTCEGLPDGPCPKNRRDRSVKLGTGDLMLCPDCDATRHQQYLLSLESRKTDTTANEKVPDTSCTSATKSTGGQSSAAAESWATVKNKRGSKKKASAQSSANPVHIFSELLQYVNYHRDRSSVDLQRKVILGFYTPTEITESKKQLVDAFNSELDCCSVLTDRRKSSTRSQQEAELDDILAIMDMLDSKNRLDSQVVIFAAVHWDRIPKYGPEELNSCSVLERQIQLEASVTTLTETVKQNSGGRVDQGTVQSVDELKTVVSDIDKKVTTLSQNVTAQISQLTAVCQQLAASCVSPPAPTVSNAVAPPVDRSLNAVIFGLPESRDSLSWREELAKILHQAAGREVSVSDARRLGGRFNPDRTRPVLVKFSSVWDRRLVLSGARKLSDVPDYRHVYIKPDETVEERRRSCLETSSCSGRSCW